MKYGVCCSLEESVIAARLGFDYVEVGFQNLSRWSDEVFETAAGALRESGLLCEASNCFLPKDLPLNDGKPDYAALSAFIEKGMSRGVKIGLKTVVFGSGAVRYVPDGGNFGEVYRSVASFLRDCAAPIAERYGITITVEPLASKECNMINTVTEGVMLASMANSENVRGLADLYHMYCDDDSCDNIRKLRGWIKHAHIANPIGRVYPMDVSEYDYASFIDALKEAGCERCSVEAKKIDLAEDGAKAIKVLRQL